MTDIERIDLIINKVVVGSPSYYYINELLNGSGDTEEHAYKRISDRIKAENVAEIIETNRVTANSNSFAIQEMGGYIKYLAIQETIKKNEEEKKEWEFRSLKSATKLNEWLYKTKLWPYIISGLSFIISVIALILSYISMLR